MIALIRTLLVIGNTAMLISIIIVIIRWKTHWFDFSFLWLLLILKLFFLSNLLRWFNITMVLDPYESFMAPVIWIFFLFAAMKKIEVTDLTSLKDSLSQSRQNLAIQRQRLENIIEATHVGTWEWNVQTGETVFNQTWAQILGRTLEELEPISIKTWEKLTHPNDLKHARTQLERHFSGERPFYQCEFRMLHKRGHWVWVLDRGKIINRTPDGKPLSVLGTHTDITKRKKMENALRESVIKYQSLFDQSPDGIYLHDLQGRILDVNQAAVSQSGYDKEELLRMRVFDMIHNSSRIDDMIADWNAPKHSHPVIFDNKHVRKDGSFYAVEVITAKLRLGEEEIMQALVRDITKRKEYEEKLKSSLHEKEMLLQELYHRTKNNMQVISAFLQLQAVSSGNEQIERIVRESGTRIRTMSLAHEMLYKAKSLSRINMKEYLSNLAHLIAVTYTVGEQKIEVACDIEDIQALIDIAIPCGLIVTELLSNSYKYAFPEGREGRIELSLRRKSESELELIVADNGVGVSDCSKLNAKKTLGVRIVHQIVKSQLSGSVRTECKKGVRWYISINEKMYAERV